MILKLLKAERAKYIQEDIERIRKEERERCAGAVWHAWGSHDDNMQDTETSRTFAEAIKTIRSLSYKKDQLTK